MSSVFGTGWSANLMRDLFINEHLRVNLSSRNELYQLSQLMLIERSTNANLIVSFQQKARVKVNTSLVWLKFFAIFPNQLFSFMIIYSKYFKKLPLLLSPAIDEHLPKSLTLHFEEESKTSKLCARHKYV